MNQKYTDQPYPKNLLSELNIPADNLPGDFNGTLEYVLYTKLSPRERIVIHGRFRDKKTLSEIGEECGVQKERIRQNEAHAIRKLRQHKTRNVLTVGIREYCRKLQGGSYSIAFQAGDQNGYKRGYMDCWRKRNRITLRKSTDVERTETVHTEAEVIDAGIETLDLSTRSFNCLKRAGRNTIRDVLDMTADDFLQCRNLGPKSMAEIFQRLELMGYDTMPLKEKIEA